MPGKFPKAAKGRVAKGKSAPKKNKPKKRGKSFKSVKKSAGY